MPVRSKWQSLPTEAINPATLAHRQAVGRRHRRGDADGGPQDAGRGPARKGPDRRRHRHHHPGAPTRAAASSSSAPAPAAGSAILEAAEMPPTFGTEPELVQAIMAGGQSAILTPKEGVEDHYEEGARADQPAAPDQARRRHRRLGERHDAVRARRADAGAARRLEDHLRHLRPAHRAADLRRPDHRAGRRPGGHRRLDAAQGRHGDQDRAQHADDRRDGPHRQDVRQPDGGRADRVREAARPRPPHHHDRHRPRVRRSRQAAAPRALERQGGDRDAEVGAHATRRR